MGSTAKDLPRRHRLTVRDYYRMAEAGILRPAERVELIEGEIIDMAPKGSRHGGIVNHLGAILQRAAGRVAVVQVQNPVSLDEHSEPEPDVALLKPRPDFYKSAHPTAADVLLIIEVAESSLRYDRDVKVPLYARHGIREVWLIDVESRRLTRYGEPREGAYVRTESPNVAEPLVIEAAPDVGIDLGEIFAY